MTRQGKIRELMPETPELIEVQGRNWISEGKKAKVVKWNDTESPEKFICSIKK